MSKRQRAYPEQATARRMGRMLMPASETRGTPVEKSASDDVRPDFGCHEWFLSQDRFNRPAGTGYFPHDSRHFVPGWPFGPAGLDILGRPKGENRIAHGLQPWEDGPERNRPERAAEGRSLFPKITFVESDSMAFQKLTKLFLIRKFAVMLGLIGNVAGNGLYARLAD